MTSDGTMQLPPIGKMLRLTFEKWYSDDIPRHAAVLAFYALFAVAPILLLCVEVLGLIYGRDSAEERVLAQISFFVSNDETGEWVNTLLQNILPSSANWWVTVGFVLALLYGASSFFNELKIVLNRIWGVPLPEEATIWGFLLRRLQAVLMVLVSSFLIFLGLLSASWLSATTDWAILNLKLGTGYEMWSYLILAFIFLTVVFALIYKFVPDAHVDWQDVWIGAAATGLLLSVTRLLIGLYFNYSYTTTMFGAASALVVILLSVYYSAQIFFLGAEFTYVYSQIEKEGAIQTGNTSDVPIEHFVFPRTLPPRRTVPVKLDIINIAVEKPLPETQMVDQSQRAKSSRVGSALRPMRNLLSRSKLSKRKISILPKLKKKQASIPGILSDNLSNSSEQIDDVLTSALLTPKVLTPKVLTPKVSTPKVSYLTTRSYFQSTASRITRIFLFPIQIFRSVRQIIVAVGVIFAISLAALAGIPFWKSRFVDNGSTKADKVKLEE